MTGDSPSGADRSDEARKRSEVEFHDRAVTEHTREKLWDTYYSVTQSSTDRYEQVLERLGTGEVLEYGCGTGSLGFFLAERGANVTGIDISPESVREAEAEAERRGLDNAGFRVMDAEALEFADDSFDLVCGRSIIHHLDLERALPEVSRTLRPGGAAVFLEPLGHNPLINLYRRRTPDLRTPDEHPLVTSDFDLCERSFGGMDLEYFHLMSLAAVPLRKWKSFPKVVSALESADRGLFRIAPFTRRHAWRVVMVLTDPIKG